MARLFWPVMAVLAVGLAILVWNDDTGSIGPLTTDQFARLIYLGAILLVIAAGVAGTRARAGQTLRQLAAWAAIVLALIAGYQYRYELQDIASRVTSGLVPGSPLALRDADGANIVQLDKGGGTHFSARGAVDGRPVLFLVDTGASATVLTAADAAAAGFAVDALRFDVPVSTANGMARAARITVDALTVGTIRRGPMRIMVAEPGRLDTSLLGMDFIGTLSGFDLRGDRLLLRD